MGPRHWVALVRFHAQEDGGAASSDPDQEEATDHYQAPGIWPVAKGQQQLAATDAVDGEE